MSFSSNHSNPKKRSAQAEDEAPRAKFPRSAFTSFDGASLPSSPRLLPLSSSLPEMHTHIEQRDAGLRLPFSLANLAPEKSKKKRFHSFQDIGDVEVTVKKPTNKPLGSSLTPSTSPRDSDEAVAPVQTEFKGPINVLDARTGQITTTRDPRGGFGFDPEANFTPESSFNSFSSVKTVVRHPISSTGLGPINLVDAHTGEILTTRDPRGGFGYDPAVNFTPSNSFDSVQTVVPPSRFPLDSHSRPLHAISLFGPARPQEEEEEEEDDDDEKTVVGSPEDVANKDEFPSLSQSSFPVSNIIEPNSSFDDVLVCRQQGDFSFTSPSTKHCSAAANMNDITEAEYYAEKLLRERPGSGDICETMCSRLERMVSARIADAKKEAKAKKRKVVIPKPADAAVQLRKYLLDQKEMRLQMGEVKEIVELELRWTDWLVDVTKSGVMHLKIPGCACRPELMAWDDEDAREKKDWW